MTTENQPNHLPQLPFPGIDPFSYAERNVFFAREQESRDLIRLIVIHRGVLLYSDSGTGKSSLINAGLLPHAITEGFQPERIRVQPRQDEEIIVERLSKSAYKEPPFLDSIFASDDSQERVVLSVDSFLQTVRQRAVSERPLLIFDQFEEWFTLFEEGAKGKRAEEAKAAQQKILDAIISMLGDGKLPVKILLVLREDYLAKLTPFFKRYPNLPDQYLRLTPLKGAAIKRIIRGPFETYPGTYQPEIPVGLAEKINEEFEDRSAGEDIRLSEVQIVCRTLFESGKAGDELTQYFKKHDGVQGILEQYLKSALDALPAQQRDPAVGLLSRMVTAAGTRNVISDGDVISRVEHEDNIPRSILISTLESLEHKSKLVRRELRREVYFYEIASEFLVAWIRAKAKERAEQRKIEETERALLEQKHKAEEQARIARRFRRQAFALLLLVILAVMAAIFALQQKNNALKQKNIAQNAVKEVNIARDSLVVVYDTLQVAFVKLDSSQAALYSSNAALERTNINLEEALISAITAENDAKVARDSSEGRRKQIEQWRNTSIAVVLANKARRQLQQGKKHLSALLARQAFLFNLESKEKYQNEVYEALRKTLNVVAPDSGGPRTYESHNDWVKAVAYAPGSELVATGDASGLILIRNLTTNKVDTLPGVEGSINSLCFSPDGQQLASGSDDHIVRIWRLNNPHERPQPEYTHSGWVWSVAYSPDGRYLASGSADSSVKLMNLKSPGQVEPKTLEQHSASVRSIAFSPDSKWFASAGSDSSIFVYNLTEGKPGDKFVKLRYDSKIRALAFAYDNRTIAFGCEDGSIRLWKFDANKPKDVPLIGHKDRINAVTFSSDGELLASASADGTVRIWKWLNTVSEPITLSDHGGWVWSLDFSLDGNYLLSGGSDKAYRIWITRPEILAEKICNTVPCDVLTEETWRQIAGTGIKLKEQCPTCLEPVTTFKN